MVVRSRAADRSVSCSKYALSRMDKMVASLAAAEEAFHQVRSWVPVVGIHSVVVLMLLVLVGVVVLVLLSF